MDATSSDNNAASGKTILVQTDTESVHLTTVLQAILQACSTNECQDPVSIVIQVNQADGSSGQIDSCMSNSEIITLEGTNAVYLFGEESISQNEPNEVISCGLPADGRMTFSMHCESLCEHDKSDQDLGSVIETKLDITDPGSSYIENVQCSDGTVEIGQRELTVIRNKSGESKMYELNDNTIKKDFMKSTSRRLNAMEIVCNDLKADSSCFVVINDRSLVKEHHLDDSQKSTVQIPGVEITKDSPKLGISSHVSESVKHCSGYHTNNQISDIILGREGQAMKVDSCSDSAEKTDCSGICNPAAKKDPISDTTEIQSSDETRTVQVVVNTNRGKNRKRVTEQKSSSLEDTCVVKLENKTLQMSESSKVSDSESTLGNVDGVDSFEEKNEAQSINIYHGAKNESPPECGRKENLCKNSDKFTCETCGKKFGRKFNLDRHLKSERVHKKPTKKKYIPKPAKCDVCSKTFHSVSAMCLHRKKHNENERYHCPHCDRKFTQKGGLNFHIKTIHHGIKEVICDRCGKQFSTSAGLMYHNQKVHLNEEMKKRYWQLEFVQKLRQDCVVTKENTPRVQVLDRVSYTCPICSQAFVKVFAWFAHLNLHTLSSSCDVSIKQQVAEVIDELQGEDNAFNDIILYPCTVCDYVAFSKSDVVIHLNRHSKDKPYLCEHCDQTFASASELTAHVQYHTKNFRHLCQICKSGFPLLGLLKAHLLKEHQVSSGDLPGSKGYRCDACGKQFIYKVNIKVI